MMNNSQGASSFFSGLSTLLGRPHPLLHNLSDTTVLMEYGGLQAAMKRSVALTKRARRQAGRGLMQRTDTWRTVRLAGARFR